MNLIRTFAIFYITILSSSAIAQNRTDERFTREEVAEARAQAVQQSPFIQSYEIARQRSLAIPASQKVIYTFHFGGSVGARTSAGWFLRNFRGIRHRHFEVSRPETYFQALNEIQQSRDIVAGILISGHGNQRGPDRVPTLSFCGIDNSDCHHHVPTTQFLEELRRRVGIRWDPLVRVAISSCLQLSTRPEYWLQEFRQSLGFSTGSIYANESMGFSGLEGLAPEFELGRNEVTRDSAFIWSANVPALGMFTDFIWMSDTIFNQGRTLWALPVSSDPNSEIRTIILHSSYRAEVNPFGNPR